MAVSVLNFASIGSMEKEKKEKEKEGTTGLAAESRRDSDICDDAPATLLASSKKRVQGGGGGEKRKGKRGETSA